MNEITLKVTTNCIRQVKKAEELHQAQITIVQPAFDANRDNKKEIVICGVIKLTVGDNHAIWHSHNTVPEKQKKDFEILFHLLANHRDEEVHLPYKLQ